MLVDTSVWIDWLQGVDSPATAKLDCLLDDGEAWLAPVILQELVQGARSATDVETLRREFIHQPMLQPTVETYLEAGTLYARCRWQGLTVHTDRQDSRSGRREAAPEGCAPRMARISPHDCLIAATAIGHGVPLLALDRDFEAIAGVEPRLELADPLQA